MSRIPELGREELDAAGQQLYDQILAARGSIAAPFRVWLYCPAFARRATPLGEILRYHTSLPPRLSELVILITARCLAATAEWAIHEPLARKAGLPGDVVEAVQADRRPIFAAPEEEALYDFCQQLHLTHTADESMLRRLLEALGNKAAVEVTGLCGYYTMVAMTLNAFGIRAGAGGSGHCPRVGPAGGRNYPQSARLYDLASGTVRSVRRGASGLETPRLRATINAKAEAVMAVLKISLGCAKLSLSVPTLTSTVLISR